VGLAAKEMHAGGRSGRIIGNNDIGVTLMRAQIIRGVLLLVLGGRLCLGGAFVLGTEHPNYLAQLPPGWIGVLNDLAEQHPDNPFLALLKQFPEMDFIIDWQRQLIGYLDPANPAKAIVWTPFPSYLEPYFFSDGLSSTGSPSGGIITPGGGSTTGDETGVPEPSTLALAPIGLAALWVARRKLRR